jgi:ABC-type uncharacterized transport system auxiliary subunit
MDPRHFPFRMSVWTTLVLLAVFESACALTGKAKALDVRYYTPERVRAVMDPPAQGPALRLGQIEAGVDLGQQIVHGDGVFRVDYYDDHRWTQRPQVYVRDALNEVLFVDRGFERVLAGGAPTLDVRIRSFQEIQTVQTHAVRIALDISLAREAVFFQSTVDTTEPVNGPAFEDVIATFSRALYRASGEVARQVGDALAAQAAARNQLRQE